ncbi:DUF2442 domain-containing protein [Butyrivibrio sp. VCD2006]|uniref:DUF2442 domain-containing protein n=1 Tax=Butyrivibrio sp. VCD2006 TaxID=1280664 RepID=UPI0006866D02|nr:DUF2442 domain-containing protein [Butyrivibrio sp. VCD2006]
MKYFEIVDEENNMSIGTLIYYEKEHSFIIELQDYLDEWSAPLLFMNHVKKGIFTISREFSLMWVKARIIPSGRQNINSILANHKLKSYDEMKFLELSHGRCSQDSLYVRKIHELPEFAQKRRNTNLTDCVVLDDSNILCFFEDNSVKKVDMKKLAKLDNIDKVLNNKRLFDSCKVGTGGYFITFNDSIDIDRNDLYAAGAEIPLTKNDFMLFVKKNLLDTTESCELLECSRQNLSYMVKEGQLSPIRENIKGNLYLKGDILKNQW